MGGVRGRRWWCRRVSSATHTLAFNGVFNQSCLLLWVDSIFRPVQPELAKVGVGGVVGSVRGEGRREW